MEGSCLKKDYKKEEKIKKEIDSLRNRYNIIKVLLNESEEKWEITHEPTKQWLYRLKLYSGEVEDICEEYDYEIIHLVIKQHDHTRKYEVCGN